MIAGLIGVEVVNAAIALVCAAGWYRERRQHDTITETAALVLKAVLATRKVVEK